MIITHRHSLLVRHVTSSRYGAFIELEVNLNPAACESYGFLLEQ